MSKTRLFFLIILIEGYVVLACELLAIRQLIPFVGSGTEVVAIVISGVLLPLAFGYRAGGNAYSDAYRKATQRFKRKPSVRRLLRRNTLIALAILSFGLSYPFLNFFFDFLNWLGISQRLVQTAAYSALFLISPVFLLGQTIPLVSQYFSAERLSAITGKMLFFSTAGSFLGSIFSTIVLMSTIGVHNTVIATLSLLTVLCLLVSGKAMVAQAMAAMGLLGLTILLNNGALLRHFRIVNDDAYSLIGIQDLPERQGTALMVNHSKASILTKDPKDGAAYVRYIDKEFIQTLLDQGEPARQILVVGSGGFTMGLNDRLSDYTFVDIDPKMKDVAEAEFLHQKLSSNKKFIATSARAFVERSRDKFDLIVLDTYTSKLSIPMECTTREYLQAVKRLLKLNGIVVANITSSANFSDYFTVRYDRTFASVFPAHTRQIIGDYNPWNQTPGANDVNVIYAYVNNSPASDTGFYTDDKNTFSIDRR